MSIATVCITGMSRRVEASTGIMNRRGVDRSTPANGFLRVSIRLVIARPSWDVNASRAHSISHGRQLQDYCASETRKHSRRDDSQRDVSQDPQPNAVCHVRRSPMASALLHPSVEVVVNQ